MGQAGHHAAPELSVIIPAYNEAARILPHLHSILHFMTASGRAYEVIVVDDGSLDETASVVHKLSKRTPAVRLLRLPTCVGKGAAVRHGMQSARGDRQLFTDADGATPIMELRRLEQALHAGAEIAIGSRSLAAQQPEFTVTARWDRRVLSRVFNRILRVGGLTGFADTQCGFKLFTKAAAQDLFTVSCLNGYGFDLELLYVAQRRGYRIAEVPVNWTDQAGSKFRLLRDGPAMLRELMAIQHNEARGFYSHRVGTPKPAPFAPPAAVLD